MPRLEGLCPTYPRLAEDGSGEAIPRGASQTLHPSCRPVPTGCIKDLLSRVVRSLPPRHNLFGCVSDLVSASFLSRVFYAGRAPLFYINAGRAPLFSINAGQALLRR